MKLRRFAFIGLATSSLLCALACRSSSSDADDGGSPSSKEGGSASGDGSSPSSDGGWGDDGGESRDGGVDGGGGCNALTNDAPTVSVRYVAANAPPPAQGGQIVPGTYFATDYTFYGVPFDAGTRTYRSTARFTATTIDSVTSVNGGTAMRESDTYTTSTTTIQVTAMCPADVSHQSGQTFTASDAAVVLMLPSGSGTTFTTTLTRQ